MSPISWPPRGKRRSAPFQDALLSMRIHPPDITSSAPFMPTGQHAGSFHVKNAPLWPSRAHEIKLRSSPLEIDLSARISDSCGQRKGHSRQIETACTGHGWFAATEVIVSPFGDLRTSIYHIDRLAEPDRPRKMHAQRRVAHLPVPSAEQGFSGIVRAPERQRLTEISLLGIR